MRLCSDHDTSIADPSVGHRELEVRTILLALALACSVVLPALPEATPPTPIESLRAQLEQGEYDEVQLAARALLDELGANAADALSAEVLDALVEALWRGGKAQEPETRELAERALATKQRAHGPDHADVAESLNNLAVVHFFTGEYSAAGPLWERALTLLERQLGPDDPAVAQMLNNLGNLRQTVGDYAGARPLYERALAIREKAFEPEHPLVAQSLNNLGVLLRNMGDFAASRPLAEKALALKTKSLGPGHPQVASSMNALATLLWEMGDRERARPMFEQAQRVWEAALGPDHPNLAASLNNLGELLRNAGNYDDALPLYERSLKIWESAYGPEHQRVALCLDNFADLLEAMGRRDRAKSYYERAAAIRESSLGPEHPDLAESLGSLAGLLAAEGDSVAARPMFDRAIAIQRASLGSDHPFVSETMVKLAGVLAANGDANGALKLALESESIGRNHLRLTGRSLSETEALRYAAVRSSGLDLALFLTAERAGSSGCRGVLDALARSRAVVLDEMAARHASVSGSSDPAVERLVQRLASTRARLANLTVRGLDRMTPQEYRAVLEEARAEKEQAEGALAAASVGFANEQKRSRLGLDDVATNLPRGGALVSYALYDSRGLALSGSDPDPDRDPDPAPHATGPAYLALVLLEGKTDPVVVPLGPAQGIDDLVSRWKREAAGGTGVRGRDAESAERIYREVGDELRRAIWDPVAVHLGQASRVFIVPDGALNLVSFAALPVGQADYLVETGPLLHYLSAERDLVPASGNVARGEGLLALGGPDYDARALFRIGGPPPTAGSTPIAASAGNGTRASCGSFDTLKFAPLPGAAREVDEIVALWTGRGPEQGGALRLTGPAASEGAFKAAIAGRRVLHLATHGFFLAGDCTPAGVQSRGFKVVKEEAPQSFDYSGYSPLLLSGLALAGANYRQDAGPEQDDGILTAEEIAGLDLSGVEWAVLSACDTGVGEIQAGEGVFGLRRAVQVAGVHTLIMSLWPVDDEATRQWMQALYRARLSQGRDSSEAVRDAARRVLGSRRDAGESGHPFYWAAFVAAGDWR